MNADKRYQILSRWRDENPDPRTELQYQSDFELLISVILSAQATDVSVNKATDKLYAVANTPQAILDLGIRKLKSYIKTIGLYNTKAANIMKTCKLLVQEHDSVVPRTREELEALPGVGRKTAFTDRRWFTPSPSSRRPSPSISSPIPSMPSPSMSSDGDVARM